MIGEVLLNRYEIKEKIGDGGMALVYKAKDLLLNRIVAVKILRSQFSSDDEFIQRFRREAQAAASLSHPNVVNIYDVGDTGEIHFIVMEYVAGKNLSEVIKEEKPLSEEFVINVASQICMALSHAHRSNIIHRDIKPHNILITEDGTVKVTDFGIAQAVASANLTQTGTVLGSVHYFSPEQARGNNVNHRSDLYSLGIVMYEMLAQRVPFTGDSPIAIALKHIQDRPTPLKELREGIDPELSSLVMRLLAKDQKLRPQSADEVLKALKMLKEEKQLEETQKLSVTEVAAQMGGESMPKRKKKKAKKGNRLFKRFFITLFTLVLLIVLIWGLGSFITDWLFPEDVVVPKIVGMSKAEAEAELKSLGLILTVETEVFDNEIPKDHIISQEPQANRKVKPNREIMVRVSKGVEYIHMPNVVGKSVREARLELTQAGFTLGEEDEVFEPELALNTVVKQEPASGDFIPKGTLVNLVVNKEREVSSFVSLPDFRGQDLESVKKQLAELNLKMGNAYPEFSTLYQPNRIIEQNPPPKTEVEVGYEVDFVYSQGLPGDDKADVQDLDDILRWGEQSQWHTAVVTIMVPEGPAQEVVILVIDDFGAREVYRDVQPGGKTIRQTVQGRGDNAKVQVYIGGRQFTDKFFKELD